MGKTYEVTIVARCVLRISNAKDEADAFSLAKQAIAYDDFKDFKVTGMQAIEVTTPLNGAEQ